MKGSENIGGKEYGTEVTLKAASQAYDVRVKVVRPNGGITVYEGPSKNDREICLGFHEDSIHYCILLPIKVVDEPVGSVLTILELSLSGEPKVGHHHVSSVSQSQITNGTGTTQVERLNDYPEEKPDGSQNGEHQKNEQKK